MTDPPPEITNVTEWTTVPPHDPEKVGSADALVSFRQFPLPEGTTKLTGFRVAPINTEWLVSVVLPVPPAPAVANAWILPAITGARWLKLRARTMNVINANPQGQRSLMLFINHHPPNRGRCTGMETNIPGLYGGSQRSERLIILGEGKNTGIHPGQGCGVGQTRCPSPLTDRERGHGIRHKIDVANPGVG